MNKLSTPVTFLGFMTVTLIQLIVLGAFAGFGYLLAQEYAASKYNQGAEYARAYVINALVSEYKKNKSLELVLPEGKVTLIPKEDE